MKYVSTRGDSTALSFSEAIESGLAPDGGLYVPLTFPRFTKKQIDDFLLNTKSTPGDFIQEDFVRFSAEVLKPFAEGDPLEGVLEKICELSFKFPIPLKSLNTDTAVLELFHGPTCAFKDVGAQFLANTLSFIPNTKPRLVLVATSGDTGGAVAAAFWQKKGFEVIILFPKGRIAKRQQQQLTCWGNNVKSLAVSGSFDDCQKLVKEILNKNVEDKYKPALEQFLSGRQLTSANSINLGRLLPQMLYYAYSSLQYLKSCGRQVGFIIPSGNLGHAMACTWAKELGFPICDIILAHNANHSMVDYFTTGKYSPSPTVSTLANAMDVGNPSNAERLLNFKSYEELKTFISAISVSDVQIQQTIAEGLDRWHEVWCPHTACAVNVRQHLSKGDWIIVATAHPAKFETVVEPLIRKSLDVPDQLQQLLFKPSKYTSIQPDIESFLKSL